MKYIDEFRDGGVARELAAAIAAEARGDRRYNLMEFCGGHTHAISRYGLVDLLPAGIRMIHGPGCPVCVLPIGRIDSAIELAQRPGLILCTYADTMRVPASKGLSMLQAKARGGDIRMVYSSTDAVRIAQDNPDRDVVFFAIGFETTTPPTAVAIRQASALGLSNFSVFCNHVLTPAAITSILESKEVREFGTVPLDGFIGPAHVSTVIGSRPYEYFAEEYQRPVVIAGFEPLDVMQAILMLVRQLNDGRAEVENEFTRAVTRDGNPKAQALVADVFELRRTFEWRGLGEVAYSALRIREQYAAFDAETRYGIAYRSVPDHKACECGAILRGVKTPAQCKVFGTACTPEHPLGSCMVSAEGACAAHYTYGRFKDAAIVAARAAAMPAMAAEWAAMRDGYVKPIDFRHGRVDMTHGSGGRAMAQLIDELFVAAFDNEWLRQANDQAAFAVPGGRMVMATDSHVVSPLFFPGGDIGCLSVHGTVNDVAMAGARPLYLAAGFILEEGFPLADLKRIVLSMAAAAKEAGVPIVTGDTKVVEQGKGDGVFITTTGVGVVAPGIDIRGDRARPGDRILVSGAIGDHGVAIMSLRENLEFETTIESDTAALHGLVAAMVDAVPGIHCLRDPTRGGLATTLNEFARQSACGMVIAEDRIPCHPQVRAACEFLGLDPLYVANEGKLVAICAAADADRLLAAMHAHPLGRAAAIIGDVIEDPHHFVQMDTSFGRRVVDWLTGEQLPEDLLMRVLLLAHSFNGLTQRVFVELCAAGHDVSIEFDIADSVTEEAVALWHPDVVIAPFLKRRIPEVVWRRCRCLVVHPGIVGDRGPSALDRAIMDGETRWGVTVIEANAEMDGGDVWASVEFPMRDATKGSLYRNEVTQAAVEAVAATLDRIARGERPTPLAAFGASARGRARPLLQQVDRAIDWTRDGTAAVLRKIRAADGAPGVRDDVLGVPVHLYDAHPEGGQEALRAHALPGAVIAQRDGAILRATRDGAVWITRLTRTDGDEPRLKLPAQAVLGDRLRGVPEAPLAPDAPAAFPTWRPIEYVEEGAVGFLHFPFHNGAMGTAQCEALRAALVAARARPTRVIVLMGGPDFWSNGIHLNLIEASSHPAEESWRNINAMNDLVREIVTTGGQHTIAAMQGNAGAGGVFLALAADRVFARDGVVLNPHYKGMGNLHGSEYWTYLLPRRVGAAAAEALTRGRLPMSAAQATACGLLDAHFGATPAGFRTEVARRAHAWADAPGMGAELDAKRARRAADEAARPLEAYRADELARMRQNFFGFDPSYHIARDHFVRKVPRSRTPLYLARHRMRARAEPAAAL